jgi:hypothetical protein
MKKIEASVKLWSRCEADAVRGWEARQFCTIHNTIEKLELEYRYRSPPHFYFRIEREARDSGCNCEPLFFFLSVDDIKKKYRSRYQNGSGVACIHIIGSLADLAPPHLGTVSRGLWMIHGLKYYDRISFPIIDRKLWFWTFPNFLKLDFRRPMF